MGVENINIDSRYLEGIIKKEAGVAAKTSEGVKERLKGIKPIIAYPFKTKPFPHQIEAFNVGNKCTDLLLADDQGLGKTKESIDIAVSRKEEIGKCLIVCGVNSVKYNWSEEIKIHSDESSVVIDGKTVDKIVYDRSNKAVVEYEAVCEVKDGVLHIQDATEMSREDVSHLIE